MVTQVTHTHTHIVKNLTQWFVQGFFRLFRTDTKHHNRYTRGSPEHAKAGTLLAGGYRACLFALTGDLDYFCNILSMPRFDLSSGPCSWCRRTASGEHTWTDFRASALWRATKWTKVGWHNWEGRSKCGLLSLPGASCYTVAYDYIRKVPRYGHVPVWQCFRDPCEFCSW